MSDKEKKEKGPKATDQFKKVIENYLNQLAANDSLFAETLKKENKSIDECIAYIFTTVQKSGLIGFADDEIYQMAVHYYDEDEIEIRDLKINGQVIVNHAIELTPEEISEAKNKARERIYSEERERIIKKPGKGTKQPASGNIKPLYPQTDKSNGNTPDTNTQQTLF